MKLYDFKAIKEKYLILPPTKPVNLNLEFMSIHGTALPWLKAQHGQPFAIDELFYGIKNKVG